MFRRLGTWGNISVNPFLKILTYDGSWGYFHMDYRLNRLPCRDAICWCGETIAAQWGPYFAGRTKCQSFHRQWSMLHVPLAVTLCDKHAILTWLIWLTVTQSNRQELLGHLYIFNLVAHAVWLNLCLSGRHRFAPQLDDWFNCLWISSACPRQNLNLQMCLLPRPLVHESTFSRQL